MTWCWPPPAPTFSGCASCLWKGSCPHIPLRTKWSSSSPIIPFSVPVTHACVRVCVRVHARPLPYPHCLPPVLRRKRQQLPTSFNPYVIQDGKIVLGTSCNQHFLVFSGCAKLSWGRKSRRRICSRKDLPLSVKTQQWQHPAPVRSGEQHAIPLPSDLRSPDITDSRGSLIHCSTCAVSVC